MSIRAEPKNGFDTELNPGEQRNWGLTGTYGEPVLVSVMWTCEFLAPGGGPFPGSRDLPQSEPSNQPRVKVEYSVEQGGINTVIADAWPGGGITVTASIVTVTLQNLEFVDSLIGVRCPIKMHVNAMLGPLNGRLPLRYTNSFFAPPGATELVFRSNVPAFSSCVRASGCNFSGTVTTCTGKEGYGRPLVIRPFLAFRELLIPITTPGNCLSARIEPLGAIDPDIGAMGSFTYDLTP